MTVSEFVVLDYSTSEVHEPWPLVAADEDGDDEDEKPINPGPGVGILVLKRDSLGSRWSDNVYSSSSAFNRFGSRR